MSLNCVCLRWGNHFFSSVPNTLKLPTWKLIAWLGDLSGVTHHQHGYCPLVVWHTNTNNIHTVVCRKETKNTHIGSKILHYDFFFMTFSTYWLWLFMICLWHTILWFFYGIIYYDFFYYIFDCIHSYNFLRAFFMTYNTMNFYSFLLHTLL